jgi:hypothetical protein
MVELLFNKNVVVKKIVKKPTGTLYELEPVNVCVPYNGPVILDSWPAPYFISYPG